LTRPGRDAPLPPDDEAWISVDVEASAPSPAVGSLLSIGACLVDDPESSFYVELRPLEDRRWDAQAEDVHRLSRNHLAGHGTSPDEAMTRFAAWIDDVAAGRRPVFVAYGVTFDWMFVADYFQRYLGRNPFGINGIDIKAWYMGARNLARWADAGKDAMQRDAGVDLPHTHNALDDAREQALIFKALRRMGRS
jgi:DNA polymerase III epsilon subunit-like protein